jgi:hypothetical protein
MSMKLPRSQGVVISATRRARLSSQVTQHHGILRQIWQLQQRIHAGSISIPAPPFSRAHSRRAATATLNDVRLPY